METGVPAGLPESRARLASYFILTLLAVFVYVYHLESPHIPKNGDEYPYEHITRLTARSGALLPLRSELPGMRNVKPPLLFWQGIVSTDWGQDWTLWKLRYPSVVYTLLTGFLVFLLGVKLSDRLEVGFVAVLSFFAFFSTYRYGRPFLTNPPEVFWLWLPFFALLYGLPAAFGSRVVFPALMGISVGIGLLYSSFALALPVSLGLAWSHLHRRHYRLAPFVGKDAGKVVVTALISLALFGCWFLVDPDPRAIWKEFVLGENLGKFGPAGSYVLKLVWGGSSVWGLALAYPLNSGLLMFPVVALFLGAYKGRRQLSDSESLLWILILTFLLVHCIPSQRSGRYLLPAMPALAILLALGWDRIGRKAFVVSLLATAALVTALTYLSIRLEQALPGAPLYPLPYWFVLAATGLVVLLGLFVPRLTAPSVNAGILLAYLSYAAFLLPFDGPLGRYDAGVLDYVQGKDVWVPYNFVANFERYRFVLPGAHIRAYREDASLTPALLVARYPLVAVQLPLKESACEGCTSLGERLDLRGRHSTEELRGILVGNLYQRLFVKELLILGHGTGSGVGDHDAPSGFR
jgi:hypothetical protein